MSPLEILILAGTVVAVLRAAHLLALSRTIPRLTDAVRAPGDPAALPSVTIACAGRDEGAHVRRAAESWLAQRARSLQVVVVDDRSSDDSSAILRDLASRDPRLLALRVDDRPSGWLGKCNALRLAASHATGDFILFTDADVRLEPDCLPRALQAAVDEDADVVVLMPEIENDNAVQRGMTAAFFHFFLTTLGGRRANRDDGRCCVGVGAFNLVRRSAYEAVGGHEPVRMQVGDDVALVRVLQHAGFRHRVYSGEGLLRLKWQHGVRGTIRGLEKNFFWGARFSVLLVAAFTVGIAVLLSPLLAPLAGTRLAWGCLGAWFVGSALPYLLAGPREGRFVSALLHPVSMALLVVTAWNSALRTLARGGISWRGDFVPMGDLKAALKPWRWWRVSVPSRPHRGTP